MEILEGNKLIAEFMSVKLGVLRPDRKTRLTEISLLYHSSWDWLMQVVDKIEKLGYDSRIHGYSSEGGFLCDFVDDENAEWGCAITHTTKIEAVWLAVINFTIYYKNTNQ